MSGHYHVPSFGFLLLSDLRFQKKLNLPLLTLPSAAWSHRAILLDHPHQHPHQQTTMVRPSKRYIVRWDGELLSHAGDPLTLFPLVRASARAVEDVTCLISPTKQHRLYTRLFRSSSIFASPWRQTISSSM